MVFAIQRAQGAATRRAGLAPHRVGERHHLRQDVAGIEDRGHLPYRHQPFTRAGREGLDRLPELEPQLCGLDRERQDQLLPRGAVAVDRSAGLARLVSDGFHREAGQSATGGQITCDLEDVALAPRLLTSAPLGAQGGRLVLQLSLSSGSSNGKGSSRNGRSTASNAAFHPWSAASWRNSSMKRLLVRAMTSSSSPVSSASRRPIRSTTRLTVALCNARSSEGTSAIRRANRSTVSSSRSAGTALATRPIRSATLPLMMSPVYIMIFVHCGPIW